MEFFSAIGLDLIALLIVLLCAQAAAKKGFLRTVVQMMAYIGVVLAASFLSRAAAPAVYDKVVEPMLLEQLQPEEGMKNASLISMAPELAEDARELLDNALDSAGELLPEDFDPQELAGELAEELADNTLRPLMVNAIALIGFVVLFSLFSLLANLLLSALGIINHLPLIGTVNAFFGGAVGILQGLLLVWVLGMLVRGLFYLYPNGWWIVTEEVVEQSYLFKYFVNPGLLERLLG